MVKHVLTILQIGVSGKYYIDNKKQYLTFLKIVPKSSVNGGASGFDTQACEIGAESNQLIDPVLDASVNMTYRCRVGVSYFSSAN